MVDRNKQKFGFLIATMMMVAALGALNFGTVATAQAERCDADGGGGGNQTESPSPSPTESEEPFPPSLPPILPDESESATPTPTETSGAARRCDSEITINYRGPNRKHPERRLFVGRVKSAEDACESGRKVLLKKVRKNKRDRIVGSTVTNQRGAWRVPMNRANGKYYAKIPQEKVPSEEGRVTCGADRSPRIRV